MKGQSRVLLPISIAAFAFLLFPIFYLFIGTKAFSGFSFTLTTLFTPTTLKALGNTLLYAFAHSIPVVAIGFAYAWIVERTDIPGKRVLRLVVLFGLAMPEFSKALAWFFMLSPRIGIINMLWERLTGGILFNGDSLWGLIVATIPGGIPASQLFLVPAVRSIDHTTEEASRTLGGSLSRTIRRVSLPALLPITSAFFVLSIMNGLSNFDYPSVFAAVGRFNTLSTLIDFYSTEVIPADYNAAASVGLVFAMAAIVGFTIYILLTRRLFQFVTITGSRSYQTVHRLHQWKWPAFCFCVLAFVVSFVLPFGVTLWVALTPSFGYSSFTLSNFYEALKVPLLPQSILNSIEMGGITVLVGVPLATIMAYTALRTRIRGSRFLEYASSIPLAFPGIIYGLALFLTFLLAPGLNILYGTIWPAVIATVFTYFPYVSRIISGNVIQVGKEIEESSRICGATFWRTFRRVILPALKVSIFNSSLLYFVNSLKELGAVVLLSTPATVFAIPLFLDLYYSNASLLNVLAAAVVMMVGIIGLVLIAFKVAESRIRG